MLDENVYDFTSIALRNRNAMLDKSYIVEQDIKQMMTNSGIRKTKNNIATVKNQIALAIKRDISVNIEIQIDKDIFIKFL